VAVAFSVKTYKAQLIIYLPNRPFNNGAFNVADASLVLYGTFTMADVGTLHRTGGLVPLLRPYCRHSDLP